MINRLVAENNIKLPFKGQPYFSITKKLIAFQTDSHIKIKTLSRQAKDIDIPINNPPISFALSQVQPWLFLLTSSHLLEIYMVEYIQGITEGSFKKVAILHNVENFKEIKSGLALVAMNKTVKTLGYNDIIEMTQVNLNVDVNLLNSITEVEKPFVLQA